MATTSPDHLGALKAAIVSKPPLTMGVILLPKSFFTLFYKEGGDAHWVDLSNASDAQVQALSHSCAAATFGVNNRDVLDETYRKAGKLDVSDFSTRLTEAVPHLIESIRTNLLEGYDHNKRIVSELYKLNVYGEGAFFKAHKDTPRSVNMFASLVLVFPTRHEGGMLTFRHKGEEWTFDSGKELAASLDNVADAAPDEASIGFAAFFSDVEHEVHPVTSGYRVTLTHNLYFEESDLSRAITGASKHLDEPSKTEKNLTEILSRSLEDPTFIAGGGLLGFGLVHQYPMGSEPKLQDLLPRLKGRDAVVARVCRTLGLSADLRIVYDYDDEQVMTTTVMHGDYEVGAPVRELTEYCGGVLLDGDKEVEDDGEYADQPRTKVHWVTGVTLYNKIKSDFVAYGNEASIGALYGDVCLIVQVKPAGER